MITSWWFLLTLAVSFVHGAVAKQMGDIDLAIIDKRRQKANESQVMHLIGDVKGRDCVDRQMTWWILQVRYVKLLMH